MAQLSTVNRQFDIIGKWLESPSLYTLTTPIQQPTSEAESFTYNSEAGSGNAVFDIEWTGGELYVGKTMSISYMVYDPDNISLDNPEGYVDPSDITVTWYNFGNADNPIHTGSSFELTTAGQDIVMVISFTDDAGNQEYLGTTDWASGDSNPNDATYWYLGQVAAVPTEQPNSDRSVFSYDEFSAHILSDATLSPNIDDIKVIAEALQGKWGGELGTAPQTLTYSITPAGALTYSTLQKSSQLYIDLETYSDSDPSLNAIEFTSGDISAIEKALADWTAITGINFVKDTDGSFGLKADLVFTKLDFAAWDTVSSEISVGAAGFAYQPAIINDFYVGDIFLASSLSEKTQAGLAVQSVASHEIGHALGLAHPHDGYVSFGDGDGNPADGNTYSDDLPNYKSVMSYDATNYFQTSTPMMYDYWFMNALYGSPSISTSNDPYSVNIDDFVLPAGGGNLYRAMVHDDGGNDSITLISSDITNADSGVYFNIDKGGISNFENTTKVIEANVAEYGYYFISDFTEIEALTTTEGSDVIDALVDWAVTIDAGDGNDEINSNGAGLNLDGGAGNDTLKLRVDNPDLFYAEASSEIAGVIKYKSDDAIFCEATDVEFIKLINNLNQETVYANWQLLAAELLPDATVPTAPTSGNYYYLVAASDGKNDDGLLYGADVADGEYVVVEHSSAFYGFALTGTGKLHDPFEVDSTAVEFTEMTSLPIGPTQFNTTQPKNIYEFGGAVTFGGAEQTAGKYAFYTQDGGTTYKAIKIESDGGSGWNKAEGAQEITVGDFTDLGTAVTSAGGYSAYVNAANLTFAPAPIEGEDFYALTVDDHGVSEDGNYVVRADKAYLVDGNAQTGYTVASTAETGVTLSVPADYEGLLSGTLAVEIATLAVANGVTAAGDYALIDNGSTGYDAYLVSAYGGAGGHFSVADTPDAVEVFTYDQMDSANLTVVGYLADPSVPSVSPDEQIFELERVEGQRYGNIITYGIKIKDDAFEDGSVTLTSANFNLFWDGEDIAPGQFLPDYSFWGEFKPQGEAPDNLVRADVPADSEDPATFFAPIDNEGISFGMFDDAGMTFANGDYLATFMLNKENSYEVNDFALTTSQYTLYNAYDADGNAPAIEPTEEYPISFDFSDQAIGINVETARGEYVENVEAFVTSLSTNDGLSIVPIVKHGNYIQYQLVMNVPIPTMILAYPETDTNVYTRDTDIEINPDHLIEISGMQIFDKSITWLTGLIEGGSEAASLTSTLTKSVRLDGEAATVNTAAADTYTGHEFFDIMHNVIENPSLDTAAALSTSSVLQFDLKGLKLPSLDASTAPVDAEGRYILAEFTAYDDGTDLVDMFFTASQKGSENDAVYVDAATRTIYRDHEDSFSPLVKNTTPLVDTNGDPLIGTYSADGSEVVVLGDGFYLNERSAHDAIGAEDALAALRVSRDTAADAANNTYSQSEIIAADFNLDGEVSSADAYDILQYAVKGPEAGKGTAKWVFIDDLDSNGALATDVFYDHVTDTFVGDTVNINATAVLIGDVTSSYSGLAYGAVYGSLDYITEIWGYELDGIEIVEAQETAAGVFTATGTDVSSETYVIPIEETGILHIGGLNDGSVSVVSDALYDFYGVASVRYAELYAADNTVRDWVELYYDPTGLIDENADGAADLPANAPTIDDVIAEVNDIFADGFYAAFVDAYEITAIDADEGTDSYVALDLDKDGSFNGTNDILIHGAGYPGIDFVDTSILTIDEYNSGP